MSQCIEREGEREKCKKNDITVRQHILFLVVLKNKINSEEISKSVHR